MEKDNITRIYINYQTPDETAEKILCKLVELHFKTVFVGAVFQIEKNFGHLWGEDEELSEDEMTEEQKLWYEKFLETRDRIFDQGNKEKKQAIAKIKNFTIKPKEK
jgi:hypothetical protein